MKKKLLSVITALLIIVTMLVTALPVSAWVQWTKPGDVKGSDYTDNPAFAKALDDLFAGDIDLYKDSNRTKEVSMPLGFRVSMNDPYYMYSTSRKTQTYGWTCFIYSNGAFNKLFGEYVHRGDALKNCYIAVGKGASQMTYSLLANANIKAGAYIRTSPKSDGSYYGNDGHSMIILAYDEKYITYLEGNGDGKGLVRITKRTYAEFNSAQLTGRGRKITHIVQPTEKWFNELYGNSPEDNTYTFKYDANGGSGYQEGFTAGYNKEFTLSSPNFDRSEHILAGWKVKRDSDGKWLTNNGWAPNSELNEQNAATVYRNGEVLSFDDSFITDTTGDVSYTAYAVWAESIRETVKSAAIITLSANREFYPVGSSVSLKDSEIEFVFNSGNTVRVTVDDSCGSQNAQTFRFNGYNYDFFIDSNITVQGDNPCYLRLDGFKGEIATLKGEKEVTSAEIISSPENLSGENTAVKITYSDGTSEELNTVRFIKQSESDGTVSGEMWTDGGFTVNWTFEVKYTNSAITVTYPSGVVKDTIAGDIFIDGNINTSDLASLKIVLTAIANDDYTSYCTADLDGDGKISTSDLANLKLKLALN